MLLTTWDAGASALTSEMWAPGSPSFRRFQLPITNYPLPMQLPISPAVALFHARSLTTLSGARHNSMFSEALRHVCANVTIKGFIFPDSNIYAEAKWLLR